MLKVRSWGQSETWWPTSTHMSSFLYHICHYAPLSRAATPVQTPAGSSFCFILILTPTLWVGLYSYPWETGDRHLLRLKQNAKSGLSGPHRGALSHCVLLFTQFWAKGNPCPLGIWNCRGWWEGSGKKARGCVQERSDVHVHVESGEQGVWWEGAGIQSWKNLGSSPDSTLIPRMAGFGANPLSPPASTSTSVKWGNNGISLKRCWVGPMRRCR